MGNVDVGETGCAVVNRTEVSRASISVMVLRVYYRIVDISWKILWNGN